MNNKLQKYAVIGDPIAHSKSPQIFNGLFNEYGINSYYSRILAPDQKMLLRLNLSGINITSPYKSSFLTFLPYELEFISPLSIVNAVQINTKSAVCYNFDLEALKKYILPKINDIQTCIIIGSGDSAVTAAYVMKSLRIKSTITARNKNKAQKIAEKWNLTFIETEKVDSKFDLMISTVPNEFSKDIVERSCPKYFVNTDYTSIIETKAQCFSGLDWLKEQARPFFHKLTGKNVNYKNLDKYLQSSNSISTIHFTGYMGSGKSTIGKLVAEKMNWEFIDIDELIVNYEGMDIADIFTEKGEAHFRNVESKIIEETIGRRKTVISSGGGAILDNISFDLLKNNSFNIFLSAEIETMFDRCFDYFRPLHTGDNNLFEKIFFQREDRYYKISDLIVNSENEPEITARKIVDDVKRII